MLYIKAPSIGSRRSFVDIKSMWNIWTLWLEFQYLASMTCTYTHIAAKTQPCCLKSSNIKKLLFNGYIRDTSLPDLYFFLRRCMGVLEDNWKHDQYVLNNFLFKLSHIHHKSMRASTFYVSYKSFKTSRKESFRTYMTWTVPQPIRTLSKDTCLILIIII